MSTSRIHAIPPMSDPAVMSKMCDIPTEYLVLHSILNSPSLTQVRRYLEVDDFTTQLCRTLYAACCEVADAGATPDLDSVPALLQSRGELKPLGGTTALLELSNGMPVLQNCESHARFIVEMAIRRLVYQESDRIRLAISTHPVSDGAPEQFESAAKRIREKQAKLEGIDVSETLFDAIQSVGGMEALMARPTRVFPALWSGLQKLLPCGGFTPGQLVVLAARPSCGKSTIAGQFAVHLAAAGHPVKVFTLEMSKMEYLQRIASAITEIDHSLIQSGKLQASEKTAIRVALNNIERYPIAIDERTFTLRGMLAALAAARERGRPYSVVFIDYLQLIDSGRKNPENRTQELSVLTRELKLAAKEYQVCIILLSQMSRAIEGRGKDAEPQLSDLRESGSIEQDADMVIFSHRPELHDQNNTELRDRAKLIIRKQRNGPVGYVGLKFFKNFCFFREETTYDVR
ncbi:MAG: replicative DNA helicase [Candidatus Acidiferrum sp.]